MVMHAQLVEALTKVDKRTQNLLKRVIHYEPVQKMLEAFLNDTSRSFEDWIWDSKTREVLSRLQDRADMFGPHAATKDHTLQTSFSDALQNGLNRMDDESIVGVATTAKQTGKELFAHKRFEQTLKAFRNAAEVLKPHLARSPTAFSSLFVTSCTNAAICGIKLQAWPTVQEYAQLALAQSPTDGKAWYCLSKVLLWEHRYDEAKQAAEKALDANPNDAMCHKVLQDIEVLQRRVEARVAKETELLRQKADLVRENAEAARALEEAKYKPRFVALPAPTSPKTPASRLNMYFQRSKEQVSIDFTSLFDVENGEPPLYECVVTNLSTKTRLATAQAPNKKAAQAIATDVAILKMWYDRHTTGTLHAEDAAYLAAHPDDLETILGLDYSMVHTKLRQQPEAPVQMTYTSAIFLRDQNASPSMYLNQLHSQGKLHIHFDITDLSDIPNNIQLFRVSAILNGRVVATHECPSKKTAKQVVSKTALDVAIRESQAMFPDQTEDSIRDVPSLGAVRDER
ncbi:hypothetical protein H310_06649 [Aphanomyces invadans]|uniref:DRBM domain-containing protein n=1 Tax=Aphanomyces invadans TaxID=157072 RepID=A0A024U5Y9_9STRA|nr:hypothetical protein H310_06649 [Aphanomyces invadans]ETW01013.1 hypothetical protein H310_06649 [Aphanomyces invadans]|eukprot:XP_008870011.1 hypothetical protein H310_06649 [Aphanomyces invadans]